MPLDGEKLDELLSGFVDGQLTSSELTLVEEALEQDPCVGQRISQLRKQSAELRAVGAQRSSQSSLPAHFGERVMSACREVAEGGISGVQGASSARDLTVPHRTGPSAPEKGIQAPFVRGAAGNLRFPGTGRWRKAVVAGGSIAATAAVLMLAIFGPRGPHPAEVAQMENREVQSVPPEPPAVAHVAKTDDDFKFAYVMVVDVQMTRNALAGNVLGDILAASGIFQTQPIETSPSVLKALNDTRMIIHPNAPQAEDTVLYVIRADMQDLDLALQYIWRDKRSFPNVSYNIAIDARASLAREILNGLGRQFSPTDSFAAPIAVEESAGFIASSPSTFPGSSTGVNYVSSSRRAQGWEGESPTIPSGSMSTILLVGHIVE